MKKHNGMRPQDIVILMKIAAKGKTNWLMKDLSQELGISASEVSESLHRSVFAGLIAPDKKRLMKLAILEFLVHGLKYVYPQKPGALTRGVPTAHSAYPLKEKIQAEEDYVWPSSKGTIRGQVIEPIYSNVPEASLKDDKFYGLMALTDALRVGKARERKLAEQVLKDFL